jgi:hypothetical protein
VKNTKKLEGSCGDSHDRLSERENGTTGKRVNVMESERNSAVIDNSFFTCPFVEQRQIKGEKKRKP